MSHPIVVPAALSAFAGFLFLLQEADPTSANPLQPCSSPSNCVLETRRFAAPPDSVYRAALHALVEMGPSSIETGDYTAHAVYRVVFFLDDVHIAVMPDSTGSSLHIRSASRVGSSDLGVNRRRVNRFLRLLDF